MVLEAPPREVERIAAGTAVFGLVSATATLTVPIPSAASYRLVVDVIPIATTTESLIDLQTRLIAERRARFRDLSDWWHEETDGRSTDRESMTHVAYLRILTELGTDAVPCMLRDMRDRGGHWFAALRQLTGESTVDAHAKGSIRRAREAWLSWGETHDRI